MSQIPCNCGGKGRTGTSASGTKVGRPAPMQPGTVTKSTPTQTPTVTHNTRNRTQSFALRMADGRVETFGSALEARAAQVRHGGTLL